MENQTSMYASESLNSFIRFLNERYDSELYESEEEIEDEILFEQFLKSRSRRGINKLILNTFYNRKKVGRDLAEKIELKKNEPQFRNRVAGLLRDVRYEAKNGYRNLPAEEQERILNCRLDTIGQIFGNDNIYNSRRRLRYQIGQRQYGQKFFPLRKEVTTLVIRCYKPNKLFCGGEQEDKDFLEIEEKNKDKIKEYKKKYCQKHRDEIREIEDIELSGISTSINQLELCPSL